MTSIDVENPALPIIVYVATNNASIPEKWATDLINHLRAAGFHTVRWHTDAEHLARGGGRVIRLDGYAGELGERPARVSRVRARFTGEFAGELELVPFGALVEISRDMPMSTFIPALVHAVQQCANQPDKGWWRPEKSPTHSS